VALELDADRRAVCDAAIASVILLDTNALIWLEQGHPRTRRLARGARKLYNRDFSGRPVTAPRLWNQGEPGARRRGVDPP
jgi:hypothetical protein